MTRPSRTGSAAGETTRIVPKHHALVRLSHWINVPVLLGLIASGLSIYWAAPVFMHAPDPTNGSREYLRDIGYVIGRALHDPVGSAWVYDRLGLGTRQLAFALRIHWLLAYLFMANGALYLIGMVRGGGWRALLPRPSDPGDAVRMMRYYVGVIPMAILRRPWPHPPVTSKYNALQRGGYFSMSVLATFAILSGWVMHKPVQLGWLERLFVSYDGARIVHFVCMVGLASFIVPHVILAIADGWDTLRSMVTGWSGRVKEEPHGPA
jgi:thiosulfate reductase cytochrome b subunit